jgi:phage tail protein X
MSVLKYYNPVTEAWEPAVIGKQGPTGATGPSGVITTTAPITNSGTETAANIGIDQSQLASVSGNAIINGAFDIWQRGTSFTQTVSEAYHADRYHSFIVQATDITRETFSPGTCPDPNFESEFYIRLKPSANTSNTQLSQRIENVRTFEDSPVTVSFWTRSSIAGVISLRIRQGFGTGGSANVDTSISSIPITTDWTKITRTFQIPSLSGKTIGPNSFLTISIIHTSMAGLQTLDVCNLQLEAGSTATAFRRNANSIQGELAACQRYYFRSTGTTQALYADATGYSSNQALARLQLPVTMRAVPTSVEFGNLAVKQHANGPFFPVSSLTIATFSANENIAALTPVFDGATIGTTYVLMNNNNAAGFLAVSAEL